jgi:hypothetical protein
VDADGKPDKLIQTNSLRIPHRFTTVSTVAFANRFPYGQFDIACLHTASKYRHLDMESFDFIFGGATLGMLANKDDSDPFYVTKVPGIRAIMLFKGKEYVQNYADLGFQFRRFVTGMFETSKFCY